MMVTFASRAFFTRFAIFGTDVTHAGRTSQMVFVMSSTRSAAPATGTSAATGSGIFGIGDVALGAIVPVGAALVAMDEAVADGDGVEAVGVQAMSANSNASGTASLFIDSSHAERGAHRSTRSPRLRCQRC